MHCTLKKTKVKKITYKGFVRLSQIIHLYLDIKGRPVYPFLKL